MVKRQGRPSRFDAAARTQLRATLLAGPQTELANFCPKDIWELSHAASQALKRIRRRRRQLIAAFFLAAGILKLVHPGDFLAELVAYRLPAPEILLRLVAVCLPWLEILCGGFLLFDYWPESVRPIVTVLCLVFVIMLGQAVVRGLDLSCGCFGRFTPAWLERPDVGLVRALLLLAVSAWLASVGAPAARVSHR